MCLSYAKFFVIFHVGTKWFVCGKPKPMTCWGLSENWPQYQDCASQRKVGSLPGFVAVSNISFMWRSWTPLYKSDGSWCFWFFWKYLHSAHIVGDLNSVLMERAKNEDVLRTVSVLGFCLFVCFFCFLSGKSGVKIFVVNFFFTN